MIISRYERLVNEITDQLSEICDVPAEVFQNVQINLQPVIFKYELIVSLINQGHYLNAILQTLLHINGLKYFHDGDFVKLEGIISLTNLTALALHEWYNAKDGFKLSIENIDRVDAPFKKLIEPAYRILKHILDIDPYEATSNYFLANILYEYLKLDQKSVEEVETAYLHVIEITERNLTLFGGGSDYIIYSVHLRLANVYSYAALQNSNYFENVFKHYNTAYRYALKHDLNTEKVFYNIEKLTMLVNGRIPVYALIYSSAGYVMYQYVFEEVSLARIRGSVSFNLSGIFAARESVLQEIFNIVTRKSILEAEDYVIVQNTLILADDDKDAIYLMLLFANINRNRSLRELVDLYEPIIQNIQRKLLNTKEIKLYLTTFNGVSDDLIAEKIDGIINNEFIEIVSN